MSLHAPDEGQAGTIGSPSRANFTTISILSLVCIMLVSPSAAMDPRDAVSTPFFDTNWKDILISWGVFIALYMLITGPLATAATRERARVRLGSVLRAFAMTTIVVGALMFFFGRPVQAARPNIPSSRSLPLEKQFIRGYIHGITLGVGMWVILILWNRCPYLSAATRERVRAHLGPVLKIIPLSAIGVGVLTLFFGKPVHAVTLRKDTSPSPFIDKPHHYSLIGGITRGLAVGVGIGIWVISLVQSRSQSSPAAARGPVQNFFGFASRALSLVAIVIGAFIFFFFSRLAAATDPDLPVPRSFFDRNAFVGFITGMTTVFCACTALFWLTRSSLVSAENRERARRRGGLRLRHITIGAILVVMMIILIMPALAAEPSW